MQNHSSFGRYMKLVLRGDSHGCGIRFELSKFPGGFMIDDVALRNFMARRSPGRDEFSSPRKESDEVEFLSGVDGRLMTNSERITGFVANESARPGDYEKTGSIPRPGHADFGLWLERGEIPSGGGMNSGRMTVALCAVGGVCLQYLEKRGIKISAKIVSVHGNEQDPESEILKAKEEGDSVGGIVECEVTGLRAGIGGALFDSIEGGVSSAMFSVPAVKGIEFGNGFEAAMLKGSENNDDFVLKNGEIMTRTNRHGGVLGGRTTGMPLTFRVAIKPTPTIFKKQKSVDVVTKSETFCECAGRHDPCIVRRALPVIEAVTAFVITDRILEDESQNPRVCLTLTGSTLDEDYEQFMRECEFVDMVELRVDLLDEKERSGVCEFPARIPRPVILTFRRKIDGGAFDGEEKIRSDFFIDVMSRRVDGKPFFEYFDLEHDFISSHPGKSAYDAIRKQRIGIIESMHVFNGLTKEVFDCWKGMGIVSGEIPKLAFYPRDERDVESVFEETKDLANRRHVICAMGPLGLPTRVSARRTHSFITYCSVGGLNALGHVSPRDLRRVKKFAVIGHPISHSLSPHIHRANFESLGFPATYERFDVDRGKLKETLEWLRDEGFSGVNVTLPYKKEVCEFLDRRGEEVEKYLACNTIRFESDGSFSGFNTDVCGLEEILTQHSLSFCAKKVCVIGRGGVGRLVAEYAKDSGAKDVKMFGRDDLNSAFQFAGDSDFIVNATPVGLKKGDETVLPKNIFKKNMIVIDLIPTTELPPTAAAAKESGAFVIDGLDFLVAQGAKSFELWTGRKADVKAMKRSLGR